MKTRFAGNGFAALTGALPSVLVVWKLGKRLLEQTHGNPTARRWARIGAAAAGVAGVAAIVVNLAPRSSARAQLDERLERELEDSFPASDPPAVTQPGH